MASTSKIWLITGTASSLRSLERLKDLEGTNDNLRLLQIDVTDGPNIITAKVMDCLSSRTPFWGRLDVIVNNAGVNYLGLLEEGGSAFLWRQFDVNVFGVMDVTTAALPHLRAQKQGTAIIMGSRSAWIPEFPPRKEPGPSAGSYTSSKAAVHALAEAFGSELVSLNIRVLLVEPSAFRTGILEAKGTMDGLRPKHPITDYDETQAKVLSIFESPQSLVSLTPGDPVKVMEAVVDVVQGEGVAKGKPWPTYLVLGSDAEKAILAKTEKLKSHMEEWTEVARGLNSRE
ncbi:hypothetical protein B0H10DRAFT_2163517 [Mycena sp. CBHHK59/15]|nr:hypothetical protein B0H10DRAFT_2163517 [Mycena sp. CBHHK59/15]